MLQHVYNHNNLEVIIKFAKLKANKLQIKDTEYGYITEEGLKKNLNIKISRIRTIVSKSKVF